MPLLFLNGCGSPQNEPKSVTPETQTTIRDTATANERPKILVMGDSLSAAYGISERQGWVALLQKAFANDAEFINHSISGETTSGGLARFPEAMQSTQPHALILALGANDGLRGLPIQTMKQNLAHMIELAQKKHTKILLLGMQMPANYGETYRQQFTQAFSDLATEYALLFHPFFLEPIASDMKYFQADGLHPTAEAQTFIKELTFPLVQRLLQSIDMDTQIKKQALNTIQGLQSWSTGSRSRCQCQTGTLGRCKRISR